jgi:hypothetical protein
MSTPHAAPPTRSRRLTRAALIAAVVLGLATGPLAGASPDTAEARVSSATAVLEAAQGDRRTAETALASAVEGRRVVEARVAELGRQDEAVTAELARARRQVREYAVAAFIDGGRTEMYLASLRPDDAAALAWRTGLVAGSTVSQGRAVDRFRALRAETEPARVAAATELDRARDAEAQARSAFLQAAAVERDAEAALSAAREAAAREAAERAAAERAAREAEARDVAAREAAARDAAARAARARAVEATRRSRVAPAPTASAAPSPSAPSPAPAGGGGGGIGDATPAELALLARIRQCESRGNYAAVSATGRYRGAYQFSLSTWRAMGGSGDPAAAPPSEQDERALRLLRTQGPRAWPVCSR